MQTAAHNRILSEAVVEMTRLGFRVEPREGVLAFLGPDGEEFETTNEAVVETALARNGAVVAVNDGEVRVEYEEADGVEEFVGFYEGSNADAGDAEDPEEVDPFALETDDDEDESAPE